MPQSTILNININFSIINLKNCLLSSKISYQQDLKTNIHQKSTKLVNGSTQSSKNSHKVPNICLLLLLFRKSKIWKFNFKIKSNFLIDKNKIKEKPQQEVTTNTWLQGKEFKPDNNISSIIQLELTSDLNQATTLFKEDTILMIKTGLTITQEDFGIEVSSEWVNRMIFLTDIFNHILYFFISILLYIFLKIKLLIIKLKIVYNSDKK